MKIAKVLTPVRVGILGMIRWSIRHWYWFVLLIIVIPSIIGSIQTARETNNPSYPFIALGLRLTDADHLIYEDVETLKTNPADLIGMEKPEQGIWKKTVYYWKFFWNVIWRILGNIWLISFPFVILYKFFKAKGSKGLQSSTTANITSAIIVGVILVFVVNLIVVATGYLPMEFPAGAGTFEKAWIVIKTTTPFKGIANLGGYLLGII